MSRNNEVEVAEISHYLAPQAGVEPTGPVQHGEKGETSTREIPQSLSLVLFPARRKVEFVKKS